MRHAPKMGAALADGKRQCRRSLGVAKNLSIWRALAAALLVCWAGCRGAAGEAPQSAGSAGTAFPAPDTDGKTGMVTTDADRRAAGFGFCDGIYLTGRLLFPSLLRYRAAGELAELACASGLSEQAPAHRRIQERIVSNLGATFGEPDHLGGWLLAATGTGRQPDVWGTLCALHLGTLRGHDAEAALDTVADAVRKGTIVFEGAVRHIPTNFDWSATSAWERTAGETLNTYQNGAYWHTPTGEVDAHQRPLAVPVAVLGRDQVPVDDAVLDSRTTPPALVGWGWEISAPVV